MMNPARHSLETLLQRATSDAAYLPALRRALQSATVIVFGSHERDTLHRPWTQINGIRHENGYVIALEEMSKVKNA